MNTEFCHFGNGGESKYTMNEKREESLLLVLESIKSDIQFSLEQDNLNKRDKDVAVLIFHVSNVLKSAVLNSRFVVETNESSHLPELVFQFSSDYYSSDLFKLFTEEDVLNNPFAVFRKYRQHFLNTIENK